MSNPIINPLPEPLAPTPSPILPPVSCFLYALYKALQKDQQTMSEQQVISAKATENAAVMESNIYKFWSDVLTKDAALVQRDCTDKKYKDDLPGDQQNYSLASSKAQSQQSQQDGLVQGAQGQTSADASNLEMKTQMAQGMNTILSMLTSLLGRITA